MDRFEPISVFTNKRAGLGPRSANKFGRTSGVVHDYRSRDRRIVNRFLAVGDGYVTTKIGRAAVFGRRACEITSQGECHIDTCLATCLSVATLRDRVL